MRRFAIVFAVLLALGSLSLMSCALPGSPSGAPKGIPVAAAQQVLRGLADDVGNFDADRDGLIRDQELSALGLQAGLRLANAALASQPVVPAPQPPAQPSGSGPNVVDQPPYTGEGR